MNISLNFNGDVQTLLHKAAIVFLVAVLAALIFLPGKNNWGIGAEPSLTGKVMSITLITPQEKAQDSTMLGTVLIQRADGYQLLVRVKHATGDGCFGNSTLHLSDIQVGETVTTGYWLDIPDTASNPHRGSAVYMNDRC